MFRNVTLTDSNLGGKKTWRLIGPSGEPVDAFNCFADEMLKDKKAPHTTGLYCNRLAHFFDYLYEATKIFDSYSKRNLVKVIEQWEEYLVLGVHSGEDIARTIAMTLPSPMVQPQTASQYLAPVRMFLKLSERVRKNLMELHSLGFIESDVDTQKLLPSLSNTKALSANEKKAMIGNSMLAGVISGGPNIIDDIVLPSSFNGLAPYNPDSCFPIQHFNEFINKFKLFRDKAYYAMLAATGGRGLEVRQLFWSDINFEKRSVQFVDPKTRANNPSYLSLSIEDRQKLRWKTREHKYVLLIEPFATIMFDLLGRYNKEEYKPNSNNEFVFQYSKGTKRAGDPFFCSSHGSRAKSFRVAINKTFIDGKDKIGAHGFRHMYATYLRNYYPCSDGSYGLPVATIGKLLGHKTLAATEKYAHIEKEMEEIQIAYANAVVHQGNSVKSFIEMKRDVLLHKLNEVEGALKEQGLIK